MDSRQEPIPVGELSEEKRQKLERKIAADSVSNPVLDMIAYADARQIKPCPQEKSP